MAGIMLRSYIQERRSYLLSLFCLIVLVQRTDATDFMVGGSGNWKVPTSLSTNNYNHWAEKTRFQIGDSLVFNYQANQDSVLRVTKENYESCNTDKPLESFSDGHTSYKFNKSGHFYFISGNKDNCKKNEKLWVIVMADRSNYKSQNQPNSSPPSPSAAPSLVVYNLSFFCSFWTLIASFLALGC